MVEEQTPKTEDKVKALKTEKKVEKEKAPSIASVFQKLGQKESKDVEQLAEKIVKHFTDLGITKNSKGKDIELSKVKSQVNAMLRDIKMERGKERGSWWSTFKIEMSDNADKPSLKIVKKE